MLARPKARSVNEFMIEQVNGPVKAVENTIIQPGETKRISGMAQFKGNSKRLNLMTEPVQEIQEIDKSN